jgi:hypothetical protein
MVVARDCIPHLAAEQLVHRHAGALALDVPQRHIHRAQHVVVHRAVPPVGLEVRALPEVADPRRVLADQPGLQMMFERGDDRLGLVIIVGRADAVKAGFRGDDLEEDPAIVRAAAGGDHFDVFDGERRQTVFPACGLLGNSGRNYWRCEQGLGETATVHHRNII